MSDLSEERKRQIREEELARARRVQEEEANYREQVRRELSGEVSPEPPPVVPDSVEPPPMIARQKPVRARNSKRGLTIGAICLLAGLALAYYGYATGFELPGVQGPYKSEVTFDGEPDVSGLTAEPDWSVLGDGVEDLVKVATKERPSVENGSTTEEPVRHTGGSSITKPRDSTPPGERSETTTSAFRAHLPAGWSVVTSTESYTEIRPDDDPSAAYVAFYHGMGFSGDIEETHAANLVWALNGLPADSRSEDETGDATLIVPSANARWTAIAHTIDGYEFVRLMGTVVRGDRLLIVVSGLAVVNGERFADAISESIRGVSF